MHRLIIGLIDGEPGDLEQTRDRVDIDAEVVTDLDGEQLVTGTAAGTVPKEVTVPVVGANAITTEKEERSEAVMTDYIADLGADPPYVAVDSGSGDFLWEYLEDQWGVAIERAAIDVDAVADTVRSLEGATVWQTGWNRHAGENVGVSYHDAADLSGGGLTQLGFRAEWQGGYFEGTMASSGYLAEFGGAPVEQVAAWVQDEILPHAWIPADEDEQTEL